MRKGTICYVDQNSGHGIIKDENEQKIQFFLMELQEEIRLNDEISFDRAYSKRTCCNKNTFS
ncbi:hypothetical protein [Pedobacter borealis]|uniref:hypothetical protein n=1 Tax=Pedobacter borealis TaxID=475254 RepID=UPI000493728B|nr:hypothetical protein [Pedobacter borealis]